MGDWLQMTQIHFTHLYDDIGYKQPVDQNTYLSIGRVTHFGAMLCNNCPADVNKLLSMPCKPDRDRSRKICIAPWTSSSSGYIVLHPVMPLQINICNNV